MLNMLTNIYVPGYLLGVQNITMNNILYKKLMIYGEGRQE